jgi:hypothetical protein
MLGTVRTIDVEHGEMVIETGEVSPAARLFVRGDTACRDKDVQVLISSDLEAAKTWKPSVASNRVRADPPNQPKPLAGLDDDVLTASGVVGVDDAGDVERCAL